MPELDPLRMKRVLPSLARPLMPELGPFKHVVGSSQGQKTGPFLHFSELRTFVL